MEQERKLEISMERTGIKRRWGIEHTIPPKQTLEIKIYKHSKSAAKRFGRHQGREEIEREGG